jgi:hypothetical protein
VDADQAHELATVLGDPGGVGLRALQPLQPPPDGVLFGRISELTEQLGYPPCVRNSHLPYIHAGESTSRSNIEPCSAR